MNVENKIHHTGVYGLILNRNNEVLLIKKTRGPYKGLLDFPGGTPDFDETLEQTLERELLEETGLKINHAKQLITLLTIFECDHYLFRHIGIIYAVNVTLHDNLKTSYDGEDSDGCVWQNIDKINNLSCSPFVLQIKDRGYMCCEEK